MAHGNLFANMEKFKFKIPRRAVWLFSNSMVTRPKSKVPSTHIFLYF